MATNQDARPFVHLRKDAEEFRSKFDSDIQECLDFLDMKIKSLICDPDSLGAASNSGVIGMARQQSSNALVEFSKAKYDIFMNVKSMMNAKEREWTSYVSEMKRLFIENVEVFLAGTKLEVRLPQSEYQPSPGPRKSPGSSKNPSSIYPSISSLMHKLPIVNLSPLGSSFKGTKDSNVGSRVQSNRSIRVSPEMKNSAQSASTVSYNNQESDSSETDDSNKMEPSPNHQQLSFENLNDSDFDSSESEAAEEIVFRKPVKTAPKKSKASAPARRQVKQSTPKTNESQSKISLTLSTSSLTTTSEEENDQIADSFRGNVMTGRASRLRKTNVSVQEDYNQSKSGEADLAKSRRGRTPTTSRETNKSVSLQEDRNQSKSMETAVDVRKGRRGKTPTTSRVVNESVNVQEDEPMETEAAVIPTKGRRGKTPIKSGAKNKIDEDSWSETNENNNNETAVVQTKGRRGKTPVKSKAANKIAPVEEVLPTRTRKGRSVTVQDTPANAVKIATPAKSRREIKIEVDTKDPKTVKNATPAKSLKGRRGIENKVEVENPKTKPSRLARNVTFNADEDPDEDLDMYTPAAAPTKSNARRKTLIPKLDQVAGADIIPGLPSTSKSKRKTISGVADLESLAPPKRSKVGSQKNIAASQAAEDADDDPLESDDNYSDWLALKNVDGKVPTFPAIYEIKVWRAKKSAYIGSCDSLRQKLTLYKFGQNSGHKHLDKFLERNFDDIQIRYEIVNSPDVAKKEAKKRVDKFVAQFKNTPAYN